MLLEFSGFPYRITAILACDMHACCSWSLLTAHGQHRLGPPNGFCITRSPDSNAETHQEARQPGAVKLVRVQRATAPGSKTHQRTKLPSSCKS